MGIRNESGQMTVELAVVFPVVLIIAVITVNALLFFSDCAAFDRVARDAVRVYATSPAYGQGQDQCAAQVKSAIEAAFSQSYTETTVSAQAVSGGCVKYTSTLAFSPNLFGRGLAPEVFGVQLPKIEHSVSYVVDTYKPGVIA